MSVAVICDRCGKAVKKTETIGIATNYMRLIFSELSGKLLEALTPYRDEEDETIKVDICRECTKDFAEWWTKIKLLEVVNKE